MTLITGKQRGNSDYFKQFGVVLAVVVFGLVGAVGYLALPQLKRLSGNFPGLGSSVANPSGYQAVFLTNNQVYFGKLSGLYSDDLALRDVYYLKVDTITDNPINVDVKKPAGKEATPAATPKPTPTPTQRTITNLIKMGEELHGPADEMRLTWEQVLYVEDLRDNSQLVESIKRYQDGLKKK